MSDTYEDGFNAGIEAAAKAADYWGEGNWKVNGNGRVRFSVYDLQAGANTVGRAIAEDIRALKLDRQPVDQAQPQS